MVSITNPSFESGLTGWGEDDLGNLGSRTISTTWKTDGASSMKTMLAATSSRNNGDYVYATQSIDFTSFTLIFDFKCAQNDSDYQFRLYVDSTLKYQYTCDGNEHTDIEILLAYTGIHTLKFGVYCVTGGNEDATVYIDNLRIKGSVYYVKVGGNDALSGVSWTNAWATINKAATTAIDGATVHIGFGDYVLEPASNKIAPQNVGATGITYHCETATTGGGTGTVSIEQNA